MTTVPERTYSAVGLALVSVVALSGCFELTGDELCAPGYDTSVDGASLCVVEQPIVIETGFDCPAERPNRYEGDGVTVCSDSSTPPPDPFSDLLPMPGNGAPPDNEGALDGTASQPGEASGAQAGEPAAPATGGSSGVDDDDSDDTDEVDDDDDSDDDDSDDTDESDDLDDETDDDDEGDDDDDSDDLNDDSL